MNVAFVAGGADHGWLVADVAPADVNEDLHVVGGAFVILTCGNLAMLLSGLLRPPASIAAPAGTPLRSGWPA
jgi:hypothetical protein